MRKKQSPQTTLLGLKPGPWLGNTHAFINAAKGQRFFFSIFFAAAQILFNFPWSQQANAFRWGMERLRTSSGEELWRVFSHGKP
jgi:hypothetical protein